MRIVIQPVINSKVKNVFIFQLQLPIITTSTDLHHHHHNHRYGGCVVYILVIGLQNKSRAIWFSGQQYKYKPVTRTEHQGQF
ncbi:hypothetical protein DERF_007914 [Dermatophagoides farinae]|uniref:Uncharacterized protein n=1 Tax=Dermatophagoides farinae TaxID=6954 RepID=A0A922I240_DERFA|nr:hypothetical protein DERF_007914 [Dermatophagoides farinae]